MRLRLGTVILCAAVGLGRAMWLAAQLSGRDAETIGYLLFADLPAGARLGTSSPRRAAIARSLRPDLEVLPIRGNVDTRLRKLHAGEYDALVLAAAGLARLGRGAEATEYCDPLVWVPAPGQGILAVQCRSGDPATAIVAAIDHAPTHAAIAAERAVLRRLGSGCRTPVGALTRLDGTILTLKGQILSLDGRTEFSSAATGSDPEALGRQVGQDLIAQAGTEWLAQWAQRP